MSLASPRARLLWPLLPVLAVHALLLALLGRGEPAGAPRAVLVPVQVLDAGATMPASRRSPLAPSAASAPAPAPAPAMAAATVSTGRAAPLLPAAPGLAPATARESAAAAPAEPGTVAPVAAVAGPGTAPAMDAAATPAALVLEPPRLAAGAPRPAYPEASRWDREEGRVTLRLSVRADGSVATATVLRSSGFARLDRAARDAALRWRLEPARRGGEAVAGTLDTPLEFRLEE